MWPHWKCKGTRGARQVPEGGSKFKWRPKDMHVEVALVWCGATHYRSGLQSCRVLWEAIGMV